MGRRYALERGGPTRLEIAAVGTVFEARLDGERVATLGDPAAIRRGVTARLPDGSELFVQSSMSLLSPGQCVTRDGRPLPESDFDPVRVGRRTAYFVAILGLLDVVALLAAMAGRLELDALTTWRLALLALVLFAVFLPIRSGSRAAVAAALVAYVASSVVGSWASAREGEPISPTAITVNVIVALWIARGMRRAPVRVS